MLLGYIWSWKLIGIFCKSHALASDYGTKEDIALNQYVTDVHWVIYIILINQYVTDVHWVIYILY